MVLTNDVGLKYKVWVVIMSWIEFKIDIPHEKMELISGYLFAQGCEGINITDDGILIYFSQFRWSEEIKLAILDYIQEFVPGFGSRNIKLVSISDKDWNKNWKKFFKPIHITGKFIVKPPWEEYQAHPGEIVLIINPQMAFGTGHHESTQLIAQFLQKYIKPGMHVLDIGTGSGILALFAEKLAAESVVAIDNDPVALKNAHENARLNNVTDNVKFYVAQPENLHPSEYDIVLANINRNVLLRYADLFPTFIKTGGKLILSGILRNDEKIMLNVFEKCGFQLLEKKTKKNWLSLVFDLRIKKDEEADSGF